jgi:hypothetical protein
MYAKALHLKAYLKVFRNILNILINLIIRIIIVKKNDDENLFEFSKNLMLWYSSKKSNFKKE